MPNQHSPKHILIVEDDRELCESMVVLLEDEGYVVTYAHDGGRALDLLATRSKPDIILLDLMMPKMNGAQFRAKQLQTPELASIPVVFLTALVTGGHDATTLHADAFLRKPFEIPVLLEIIADLVRRSAS
jgi:CheY-like chemotaxis protein